MDIFIDGLLHFAEKDRYLLLQNFNLQLHSSLQTPLDKFSIFLLRIATFQQGKNLIECASFLPSIQFSFYKLGVSQIAIFSEKTLYHKM